MERRNAWKIYTADQLKELDQINSRYKVCLDEGKTERECVRLTVKEIEKKGDRNLKDIKGSLKAGDKVYAVCMGKSIAMFQIGKEPLENGMNIRMVLMKILDLKRLRMKLIILQVMVM